MRHFTLVAGLGLFLSFTSHADDQQLDSSRIATGQFDYRTTLQVGDTVVDIDSVRHIRIGKAGSHQTLQIETVTRTGMGPTTDLLELDWHTLMPIEREVRQGGGEMRIHYDPERITGYIRAAGQTVTVDVTLEQPAYAGESGLEAILAAMPLTSGQQSELHVLEIDVNTRVRRFQLSVGDVETIEVPAGRFAAWPVHVSAMDELDDEQTIWISDETPHVFLRAKAPVPDEMGGGSLTTVLVKTTD